MKTEIKIWQNVLLQAKLQKKRLEKQLQTAKNDLKKQDKHLLLLQNSHEIAAAAVVISQQKAKEFIEEIVSLCLKHVYGDGYGFILDYQIKANRTEVTPLLLVNDSERSFRGECGGGVIDIAAFASRIALWAIQRPRMMSIFFLDEPLKFVPSSLREKAAEMFQHLSRMLGIQIIMITHDKELAETADRSWLVEQTKGKTTCVRI